MSAKRSISIRAGAFASLALFVLLLGFAPRAAAEETAPAEPTPPPTESSAPVAEAPAPAPVEVPAEPAPEVPAVPAPEASAPVAVPVVEEVTTEVETTAASVAKSAPAEVTPSVPVSSGPSAAPSPSAPVEVDPAAATGALHDATADVTKVVAGESSEGAVGEGVATVTKTVTSAGDSTGQVVESATAGAVPAETLRRQTEAVGKALSPIAGPGPSAALEKLLPTVTGVVSKGAPEPVAGILSPTPTATDLPSSPAPSAESTGIPRTTAPADTGTATFALPNDASPTGSATEPSPLAAGHDARPPVTNGGSAPATGTAMTTTSAAAASGSSAATAQASAGRGAPANGPAPRAPFAPAAPSAAASGGSGPTTLFFPLSALAVLVALSAPAGLRRSKELLERCSATPFVCALERPG